MTMQSNDHFTAAADAISSSKHKPPPYKTMSRKRLPSLSSDVITSSKKKKSKKISKKHKRGDGNSKERFLIAENDPLYDSFRLIQEKKMDAQQDFPHSQTITPTGLFAQMPDLTKVQTVRDSRNFKLGCKKSRSPKQNGTAQGNLSMMDSPTSSYHAAPNYSAGLGCYGLDSSDLFKYAHGLNPVQGPQYVGAGAPLSLIGSDLKYLPYPPSIDSLYSTAIIPNTNNASSSLRKNSLREKSLRENLICENVMLKQEMSRNMMLQQEQQSTMLSRAAALPTMTAGLNPVPIRPLNSFTTFDETFTASSRMGQHLSNSKNESKQVPTCLPISLAIPEDNMKLSSHQVLLRIQIEAFKATEDDVSTHTRGRNKPVMQGQVGIRCRYCAHLPVIRREKGSTYFPSSLKGLYQAAQNMSTTHMQTGVCNGMPSYIKHQLMNALSSKNTSSGAGRKYWADSALKLGLVDTEEGIRFVKDLL